MSQSYLFSKIDLFRHNNLSHVLVRIHSQGWTFQTTSQSTWTAISSQAFARLIFLPLRQYQLSQHDNSPSEKISTLNVLVTIPSRKDVSDLLVLFRITNNNNNQSAYLSKPPEPLPYRKLTIIAKLDNSLNYSHSTCNHSLLIVIKQHQTSSHDIFISTWPKP